MNIPNLDELNLLHQQVCMALGDPKRIQILYALHEQPMHVSELAAALDMPQPTVSRHLGILRERSIVVNEREGATVIYRVRDSRIIDVLDTMRQLLRDVLESRANKLT
ncbi:MAG: winged helix-turn-helix transcriptional regulator [Anaerolineae bacterium]|nr:winged helix-turn-helix transcriptional regulator [Anaerolineae bacterium]